SLPEEIDLDWFLYTEVGPRGFGFHQDHRPATAYDEDRDGFPALVTSYGSYELQAASARQNNVGYDQIGPALPKRGQGAFGIRRGHEAVTLQFQDLSKRMKSMKVVFDQQDCPHHRQLPLLNAAKKR